MAVYRIYPEKDATINSKPNSAGLYANAGMDEILNITSFPDDDGIGRSSRILIKFRDQDIDSTINTKVSGAYSASLHLQLANASQLPYTFKVIQHPISQSWMQGTGKSNDSPINRSGVNWGYTKAMDTTPWTSLGSDYISGSYSSNQVHDHTSDFDINLNVTALIQGYYGDTIDNHGSVIKLESSKENETTSSVKLAYFGVNTNTIFPPYLEFKWDDSSYTSTLSVLSTDIATVNIKNLKETYSENEIARMRISARPKYPTRTFSTGSIYLQEYKLPQPSYWAIKDEFSEEMIVDFDEQYTKLSADNTSSYFDIDMDLLQPERFYRLLIKTTLDGSTSILDNRNVFKVVRNGK